MSDRAAIFDAIRRANPAPVLSANEIAAQAASLVADRAGVQPDFGGLSLLDRFVAKATSERVTAMVNRVAQLSDVPAAVAGYLNNAGLTAAVAVQNCALLEALDWSPLERTQALEEDGGVAVTCAEFGIAETGSVVFRSGADRPVMLNFLPLHHIVVLNAENLLAYPEDLWVHLGGRDAPQSRLLTIVTGTSGTADIEARNVRGAHGPRHMMIVIYGG